MVKAENHWGYNKFLLELYIPEIRRVINEVEIAQHTKSLDGKISMLRESLVFMRYFLNKYRSSYYLFKLFPEGVIGETQNNEVRLMILELSRKKINTTTLDLNIARCNQILKGGTSDGN